MLKVSLETIKPMVLAVLAMFNHHGAAMHEIYDSTWIHYKNATDSPADSIPTPGFLLAVDAALAELYLERKIVQVKEFTTLSSAKYRINELYGLPEDNARLTELERQMLTLQKEVSILKRPS